MRGYINVKRLSKIWLLVLMVMCITLAGCGNDSAGGAQEKNEGVFTEPEEKLDMIDSIDTSISDTLIETGYTVEHATEIQEILNTLGIESIEVTGVTGVAEEGLNAVVCMPNGYTTEDRRFSFTTEDGVLFYAGFLNEDLYDSDKGGYLKNYADVHVPEKTVSLEVFSDLQELSCQEVKKYLNHPQSADFDALNWRVGRSDDHYQILGSVTASNSFGVKDNVPFSVWFVVTDSGYGVEGVEIDGTRVK